MDSSSPYSAHARRLEQEACKAHKEWLASLTPEEIQEVKDLGLYDPPVDSPRAAGHNPCEQGDAADSNKASKDYVNPAHLEPVSTPADQTPISNFELDGLRRVVGTIISEDNVRIAVAGLAFALNMDALNGLGSIREYAQKIGVSPEAISKKKREWEKELGISHAAFSKTDTACEALSFAQKTKHWRGKKWEPLPPKPAPVATRAPSPTSPTSKAS